MKLLESLGSFEPPPEAPRSLQGELQGRVFLDCLKNKKTSMQRWGSPAGKNAAQAKIPHQLGKR